MYRFGKKGFTLIELLVVISIISILAGLVSVNLTSARVKARDNARQADLAAIAQALELYRSEKKVYPSAPSYGDVTTTLSTSLVPQYLNKMPLDPKVQPPYSFGKGYVYISNQPSVDGQARPLGSFFVLDAALEQKEIDKPLDPSLASTTNDQRAFFTTGFYIDPSTDILHFRISSP